MDFGGLLRGSGGLMNLLEKEKLRQKSFFQIVLNEFPKICEK